MLHTRAVYVPFVCVCPRSCSWRHWSMGVWGCHCSKIINDAWNWWLFKAINARSTTHMHWIWHAWSPTLHPFSELLILLRASEGLESIPACTGREAWTCCLSITWLTHMETNTFTLTFTPTGYLEAPVDLTCMSLEPPADMHTDMEWTCKRHSESPPLSIYSGVYESWDVCACQLL